MNNKLVYGGLVVAIVIATVSLVKSLDTTVGSQGLQGPRGEQGAQGPVGPQGPAGKDGRNGSNGQVVGSVTGPDTYLPYVANNNFQRYGESKRFVAATTTVCAIKSPAATSTLMLAGVSFTTSSTTASVVTLAKAATAFATTTRLAFGSIAANAQGTIFANATSTGSTGSVSSVDDITTFAPNTYFVVGMQDSTPEGGDGTFSPAGSCSAEFVRI